MLGNRQYDLITVIASTSCQNMEFQFLALVIINILFSLCVITLCVCVCMDTLCVGVHIINIYIYSFIKHVKRTPKATKKVPTQKEIERKKNEFYLKH